MQNISLVLLVAAGYLCVQSWRSFLNTAQSHNKCSQCYLCWISFFATVTAGWCTLFTLIALVASGFNLENTNFGQNMCWTSFICFVVSSMSNQINISYVQHNDGLTGTHA